MIGVNFSVCIVGILKAKAVSDNFLEPIQLIEKAAQNIRDDNGKFPLWLHNTQQYFVSA